MTKRGDEPQDDRDELAPVATNGGAPDVSPAIPSDADSALDDTDLHSDAQT